MMQRASGTKKTESTKSQTEAAPSTPDLRNLLGNLRLPGVDIEALIQGRRKDVEALVAANQKAYQGFDSLIRRQGELLSEAMKEWQSGAKELLSPTSGADMASKAANRAQEAFGHALANMRDLAEMATKSHEEVVSIVNKRMRERLDELRSQFKPKA